MNEEIQVNPDIKLDNRIMIIGLGGWGNGGEVSTYSVKYLTEKVRAQKLSEVSAEKFHHYLIQRPLVSINKGLVESYISPKIEIYQKIEDNFNLVLFISSEPHFNWPEFIKLVLKIAIETGIKQIYTIGGYLADIDHTSDTPITATTNNETLLEPLEEAGLQLANYKGPTSVYSELMVHTKDNIDVISLWCAVPYYIKGRYPQAAYNMINKILQLTGFELDLKDLEEQVKSYKVQLESDTIDPGQLYDLIDRMQQRKDRKNEPTYFI